MAPGPRQQRKLRALATLPLNPMGVAFAGGMALVAATIPVPALAHVEIDAGNGQYVMEVGFRDEPAYLGQPNALFLSVEQYATGGTEPVEGLAATLEAKVSKDGRTMSLSLVPLGEGEYQGVFVPTATGDYTFHIAGTIGETTVDETVTSGPTTFNSVEPLSAIEFPVPRPDPAQLAAAAANAAAAAASARILAIAGIAAGLLGLVAALVALTRSRRSIGEATATPIEPAGKLIR